jgi:hypothetical protein
MTEHLKPPPTLEACRVLEYAILDSSVRFSGHSNLFRGEKEVGPVPRLAICERAGGGEYFLFHCDNDWTVLGIEAYESIAQARISAEEVYPGAAALWIDPHVTTQEAAMHLDELWDDRRCNLCGKTPLQFENPRFIEKNGTWIYESCVKSCYELLQEDAEGR